MPWCCGNPSRCTVGVQRQRAPGNHIRVFTESAGYEYGSSLCCGRVHRDHTCIEGVEVGVDGSTWAPPALLQELSSARRTHSGAQHRQNLVYPCTVPFSGAPHWPAACSGTPD